jgi:hypothetical protein
MKATKADKSAPTNGWMKMLLCINPVHQRYYILRHMVMRFKADQKNGYKTLSCCFSSLHGEHERNQIPLCRIFEAQEPIRAFFHIREAFPRAKWVLVQEINC